MIFTSSDNEAQLYGTIWNGDGTYVVGELNAFLKGKTDVTIHLHTPGGSVFDGNLIYNALKNAKATIHIVIDGLAASMGSILMLAGKTVSIADNAFVMIHAPSGLVEGDADSMQKAAVLLTSLEKQFISKYAAKTGKTEEELKNWLKGDNWFSADDALANGLVDDVITSVIEDQDINALQGMSIAALASSFDKQFLQSKISNPQKQDSMKLTDKNLQLLGLATDAKDESVNESISAVIAENEALKNAAKEEKQARITALIDAAVTDGRITAKEKEDWTKLANADFSLAESSLGKLAKKEKLPVAGKPNTETVDERKDWTFTDWSRKDTSGLLKMKKEDPEKYAELCNKSNVKYK